MESRDENQGTTTPIEKSQLNSKQSSTISLAPTRTLSSVEDISDRTKRILKTLEKAIDAYTKARIHLSNLEVEEAKLSETNHSQETVAREMLAQGEHYISLIGMDPSRELGMDALSDLALTYISSYNAGISAYEAKCRGLSADIDEVARLADWCGENVKHVECERRLKGSTNSSLAVARLTPKDVIIRHNTAPLHMTLIPRIRRRGDGHADLAAAPTNIVQPLEISGNSPSTKIGGSPQTLTDNASECLLRAPHSLNDIFTYAIAQR